LILQELLGSSDPIELLSPPGASPHSFEPSPHQLQIASQAKAFFFVSPRLDAWIKPTEKLRGYALIHWVPWGSRLSPSDLDEHQHPSFIKIINPHFWMDPIAVEEILPSLRSTLCELETSQCQKFKRNENIFSKALRKLNRQLEKEFSAYKNQSLVTSHDFLLYFAKRYKLGEIRLIEPFAGKEPSPKDLVQLSQFIRQKHIKCLFDESQLPEAPAKTLAENNEIKVVRLDAIGADPKIKSYIDLIEWNAKQILRGLKMK